MLTRTILLYLARQDRARELLVRFGFSRRAAFRFVAGEDIEDALETVAEFNRQGVLATLDYLGENVHSADDVYQAVASYVELFDKIASSGVKATVSLKLTQLGLNLGEAFCHSCISSVLDRAAALGNFVTIDMESSEYTERTLELFKKLRAKYENVGTVIQSYLYRSAGDVEDLIKLGANIRLCKGAYQEPSSVAYPRKADVDRNYIVLMERLLSPEARAHGVFLAIATHDPKIIARAKDYVCENKVPRDSFEFQMLYGVRRDLQRRLAAEGYPLRIYVPYGKQWYPYFMRRLAERPANIVFILKAIASELGH